MKRGAFRCKRGREAAWQAFAFALATFAFSSAAADNNETCLTIKKADLDDRTNPIVILWNSVPALAAAAILRAALLSASYSADYITLQYNDTEYCSLIHNSHLESAKGVSTIAISVPREANADCMLFRPATAAGGVLTAVLEGLAPVTPRLHVRLSDADERRPHCVPSLLQLRTAVDSDCNFQPTRTTNGTYINVYVPDDEWKDKRKEFGAYVKFEEISRGGLEELINGERNESILFLDAPLWGDAAGARALPDSTRGPAEFLLLDRNTFNRYAPAVSSTLEDHDFRPDAAELRAVLARGPAHAADTACRLLPTFRYKKWQDQFLRFTQRSVTVLICNNDIITLTYAEKLKTDIDALIRNKTNLVNLNAMFVTQIQNITCEDRVALREQMIGWKDSGASLSKIGVVAPAELAAAAASKAADVGLPVLAYTAGPAPAPGGAVRSATCSAERLAAGVRWLLRACNWRRLALLSDGSDAADAMRQELLSQGFHLLEPQAVEPPAMVEEMRGLGATVFFVNGDAAWAALVLAEAAKKPDPRQAWLVRDYEAADEATDKLQPLYVSCTGRGRNGSAHDRRAPQRWDHVTEGPWPRLFAPVTDAVLTLAAGYERLVRKHPEARFGTPKMTGMVRSFWNGVQSNKIPGIIDDLEYDDRGVNKSRIYIERWLYNESWPQSLAELKPELALPVDPLCPADLAEIEDGSRWSAGAWAGLAAAAALGAAALAGAAAAGRRWVARRDMQLERATVARVLAQREASFADLAPDLVPRDAVVPGPELGAGRFGRVVRAELRRGPGGRRRGAGVVAAKALRERAAPSEETQFLREARLLAALHHPHVVRFRGLCWDGGAPLLFMELAEHGDLLRYLRARRHLAGGGAPSPDAGAAPPEEAAAVSAAELTRLAREAAEALEYLRSRGLVHRDVRAANCLVDARRSLKLADFGLARETGAEDGEYACRGRALFPVLWMAPESLARGVATAASDAWSFGVLALELVTLGARPWGGAAPEEAVRAVLAGGRPPLPRDASAETRALVRACWRREPAARPAPARLAAWLARRPAALRPALAPHLDDPDCDSGIGEADPLTRPRPRSSSLDSLGRAGD